MDVSWVDQYLNKPWEAGAYGPDKYDCIGLLWSVYVSVFGVKQLDKYDHIDRNCGSSVSKSFIKGSNGNPWVNISEPAHRCAVLMGAGKYPNHVGVYLAVDGGVVLHATAGANSTITSVHNLMSQFNMKIFGFYQHKDLK